MGCPDFSKFIFYSAVSGALHCQLKMHSRGLVYEVLQNPFTGGLGRGVGGRWVDGTREPERGYLFGVGGCVWGGGVSCVRVGECVGGCVEKLAGARQVSQRC